MIQPAGWTAGGMSAAHGRGADCVHATASA